MVDSNIRFSRVDQLVLQLKERCQGLRAGEKFLSQRQIMTEFGVSQITVKQAVERLCDSGVLEAEDRRGYFVRRNRRFGKILMLLPKPLKDLTDCLSAASREIGFELETLCYGENEEDGIRMLADCKADAILFSPFSADGLSSSQLNRIQAFPVPVFLLYSSARVGNCRFIDSDNDFCGVLAATTFMLKGHRRLGLFVSEPKNFPTRLRVNGFLKCARAFGAEVELLDPEIENGENSPSRSYRFFSEYLDRTPELPFTALFVISALPALELMRAAKEHNLSIPGDFSFMSMYIPSFPSITSIDSCNEEISRSCIRMIEEFFADRADAPLSYIVSPRIHAGNTVKNITANPMEAN